MKRRIWSLVVTLAMIVVFVPCIAVQAGDMQNIESYQTVALSDGLIEAIKDDGSLWEINLNNLEGDIKTLKGTKIMDDVLSVDTNGRTTLVIKGDDSLWGWGSNYRYQLADKNRNFQVTSPVKILDDVNSVSVGETHVLAIRKDKTVWGWAGTMMENLEE